MRIMVFDVPAESGGALSILNEFYYEYMKDETNSYVFVVSIPDIQDTKNITVLRFPWIKKSWLHRLYFDNFIAPKLIVEYKVDQVLSLQNLIIPRTKVKQTVYVHNSLPFSEYRFSIIENKLLWTYQNILSKSIYKSIKKANKVIVQTEWMKWVCVEKLHVDQEKIEVSSPILDVAVNRLYERTKINLTTFFYPANAMEYKNHKIVVEACLKLKEAWVENYEVVFTLEGNENKKISDLYEIAKKNKLSIMFIGNLTREQVFDYYSKSVLVFPSYIETVGLPLIEAKLHGTPIIVTDCAYSREVLDGYNNVCFFNPLDKNELFILMREKIEM